jgi:hypothetical protein
MQKRMGHTVIQSLIRFIGQKGGEKMKNGKEMEFADRQRDKIENWMTIQRNATDLPKQYGEAFYFCNSCRTCIEPQTLFGSWQR